MRRRGNGEAGRGTLPARCLGGLHGPSKRADVGAARRLLVDRGTLGATLLARLDDLPLPLSYVQAALELGAHGGVLGVEAGGQAGEAHVHDVGAARA